MKKQQDGRIKMFVRRYRPSIMEKGMDLVKQLDHIIKKVNGYHSFDHRDEQEKPIENVSMQIRNPEDHFRSKNVLKRIINNPFWNQLIDRQYNKSKITKTSFHQTNLRHKSQVSAPYVSSNLSAFDLRRKDDRITKLFMQQNKIRSQDMQKNERLKKLRCLDLLDSFFPIGKSPKISKKIKIIQQKVSHKFFPDYKHRHLKWQQKSIKIYHQQQKQHF